MLIIFFKLFHKAFPGINVSSRDIKYIAFFEKISNSFVKKCGHCLKDGLKKWYEVQGARGSLEMTELDTVAIQQRVPLIARACSNLPQCFTMKAYVFSFAKDFLHA
jgi:hypothetical protein